jgi:hypothetical protein
MSSKRATVIGWTGGGRLDDLRASARYVLGDRRIGGRLYNAGRALALEGPEPISVAVVLKNLPGVAWVAAGRSGRSIAELGAEAGKLARAYVASHDTFAVLADGPTPREASDLGGSLTSSILETVKGSRVSLESPEVTFRASFDGKDGVVGVEVETGPGGVPTAKQEVVCMVSGGVHSSVMAWFAVLQGFRVTIVHVDSGEVGLRAVAHLYSELSHRADPRSLNVEVFQGASLSRTLSDYARKSRVPVYAGFSRTGEPGPRTLTNVTAPLYLMPQERFMSEFDRLGLRGAESETDWDAIDGGTPSSRRFGGKRADVSEVLDSLART